MSQWKVGPITVKAGYTPAPAKTSPGGPRDPSADRLRLQQIQAAAQAQDFVRAATLAEAALKDGIEHPMVLSLAAMKCEQEGRFEDALKVLDRAMQLAPQDLGARNAAGLVLTRMARFREALAMFDSVVALAPAFAGAHCARGATLEALGRPRAAEAAYRHALELDPDNLGAVQGVANLLSRRGEHAEARPLAEDVLEVAPNFPDAVMVLAAADAAEGAGERARQRLEMLAADERLTPHQRALAQGQLGDVLDAQGLAAEAFEAYLACNKALQQAYAPLHGQGPSALDAARALLAELDAVPPTAWTGPAAPAPPEALKSHVFLVGFPGSGADALADALARDPGVEVLDGQALPEPPGDLGRLAHAGEAELAPLREAYWTRVRDEGGRPAGKVFVDSHPQHTFRLPLILKLFPDAKIVFARRDPRDAVLDAWRHRVAMDGAAYQLLTLPGAAAYYDAAMSLAERLQPALADRALVVRHETLAEDAGAALGELRAFLGLAPADADLALPPPGAWRRYASPMAAVASTLAPWVGKFGYAAE